MYQQLDEKQSELVNNIAKQNGFLDFKVQTSSGSEKGDNYLGIITKITVENKDGRKLELILKSVTTSEALRKKFPVREAYLREIFMYDKLFVEFQKFQDEYNIPNPFSAHPKFFGSSLEEGREWLLMENITQNGFSMWDRKKPMKPELIEAVFIEYAKLHAVSLAMRRKKPDLYRDLISEVGGSLFGGKNEDKGRIEGFIKSVLESGSKALADEPNLLDKFKKICDNMDRNLKKSSGNSPLEIVVKHGDNWCNNMMFKYTSNHTTQLPEVCLFDWQLAKEASPAEDLTYFFLAHSPKEVLYNYEHYLKIYHETISKNLRDFSCDPEKIFPYSLLELHWKIYIHFGLFMAMLVLKLMYSDSDEALDFGEISEAGGEIMKSFTYDLKNASGYSQRVKDLMQFLDDSDMIDIDYTDIVSSGLSPSEAKV